MAASRNTISDPRTALNAKEQRVVDSYLRAGGGLSMTAAFRAEFGDRSCAYKFFKRKHVKAYIDYHQAAARDATGLTIERLIEEMGAVAFANIADADFSKCIDEEGRLDMKQLPENVARAIESVKVRSVPGAKDMPDQYITEVKFHSKPKSIDMIAKTIGAYAADNKQRGDALAQLAKEISAQGLLKPKGAG